VSRLTEQGAPDHGLLSCKNRRSVEFPGCRSVLEFALGKLHRSVGTLVLCKSANSALLDHACHMYDKGFCTDAFSTSCSGSDVMRSHSPYKDLQAKPQTAIAWRRKR
jgi:hypothetical protein